jgi:hypothetical protein
VDHAKERSPHFTHHATFVYFFFLTIENDVVEEHKVDDHLDPGLHRKSQSSPALFLFDSLLFPSSSSLPHLNGENDCSFPTFSSHCYTKKKKKKI